MNEKIVLVGGILVVLIVFTIILKVCGNIRSKVYELFIRAEKEANKGEKMDFVIGQVYILIPSPINLFINENVLRWILQKMFDVIKDFLNDGTINNN